MNDDAIGIATKGNSPYTEWKGRYSVAPWMVGLEADVESGLTKTSAADAFQVRSVAQERFDRKVGRLSDIAMQKISGASAIVLDIES